MTDIVTILAIALIVSLLAGLITVIVLSFGKIDLHTSAAVKIAMLTSSLLASLISYGVYTWLSVETNYIFDYSYVAFPNSPKTQQGTSSFIPQGQAFEAYHLAVKRELWVRNLFPIPDPGTTCFTQDKAACYLLSHYPPFSTEQRTQRFVRLISTVRAVGSIISSIAAAWLIGVKLKARAR